MKDLPEPLQQLIDRKLWPIALALLVALAAIPMLLSSDEDTSAAPSPIAEVPATETTDASVVTVGDAAERDEVRAVLGNRKDPFRPAQLHRVKKEEADGLTTNAATKVDTGGSSSAGASGGSGGSSGSGTTSGGAGGTVPAPTATPAPQKTYVLYSLKVRFGTTDGDLQTREVKRLTGLPGGTNPAALYLGLLNNRKSAVFIIDAGVKVLGDGRCDPSPTDCQTLTMQKGETMFLTRGDKQWQLDLIDIKLRKTTDAKAARASRRAIAEDGRQKLRRLVSRVGRFRYDESSGSLDVISKAAAARASARAPRTASFESTG